MQTLTDLPSLEILNLFPDGVLIIDQTGCIRQCNHQLEKIFGYSSRELVAQPIECLLPHVHRQNHVAWRNIFLKDSVSRPMAANNELTGLHRDGTLIPVLISLAPMVMSNERFVMACVRDMGPQKRVLQDLHQAQARYKAILENMTGGVAIHKVITNEAGEPINLEVFDFNDAVANQLGLTRDAIGKLATDVFPDMVQTNPGLLEAIGQVGLDGSFLKKELFFQPIQKWFRITVYCPSIGYAALLSEDVTDTKQTEVALRESEQRYRDLYEHAPDMFFSVNLVTGQIEKCNFSFASKLGYSPEELIGFSMADLYHPSHRNRGQDAMKHLCKTGDLRGLELPMITRDGHEVADKS